MRTWSICVGSAKDCQVACTEKGDEFNIFCQEPYKKLSTFLINVLTAWLEFNNLFVRKREGFV